MASAEMQLVVEMLRAHPFEAGTVEQRRAGMDALTAAAEVPANTSVVPVDAGGVPGEWVSAPDVDAGRILVYYHGGGYCMGSPATHRRLCALLSDAAGVRVLNVDYRLAPEHPYPQGLDDAVTSYLWALDQGDGPARTVIGGDSAGGGLTLATLLRLRDEGKPLPAGAIVLSPWTDLAQTGESLVTRKDVDPMVTGDDPDMIDWYLAGADARDPLASPLYGDYAGLPPIYIQVGDYEVLLDDSTRVGDRARAAGVDITCEVWPEMIHVFPAFAGFLPEADQAIAKLGAWIREHC